MFYNRCDIVTNETKDNLRTLLVIKHEVASQIYVFNYVALEIFKHKHAARTRPFDQLWHNIYTWMFIKTDNRNNLLFLDY